jgi:hypothetical protein
MLLPFLTTTTTKLSTHQFFPRAKMTLKTIAVLNEADLKDGQM